MPEYVEGINQLRFVLLHLTDLDQMSKECMAEYKMGDSGWDLP